MHPLQHKHPYSQELGRRYAAVQVEHRMKTLVVIPGSISILRHDTKITEVPKDLPVVDEEGNPIRPVGRFYITTSTIDPYHMVVDILIPSKEEDV